MKTAGVILLICLLFLSVFHLLVIFKILPSDLVWGGNLAESPNLYLYETIALIITLLMVVVTVIQAELVNINKLKKTAGIMIWIMTVYFLVSVFTNLTSKTFMEKVIFIPLSAIMLFCSLILAVKKKIK